MFQRILIPLDGSLQAEQALPIAARLARTSGGTVVLLQVVSPHLEYHHSPITALPSASMQTMLEVARSKAIAYLTQLACRGDLQVLSPEIVVVAGQVASMLLSVAQAHHCDLIMLSRYGSAGSQRWILGEVVEKVVHACTLPVLVLHEQTTLPGHASRPEKQPLCALIPLDGSPQAEAVFLPAVHLVTALSDPGWGALHLMHVIDLMLGANEADYQPRSNGDVWFQHDALQREVQTYLRTKVDQLQKSQIAESQLTMSYSILTGKQVGETLLKEIEHRETTGEARRPYDLVVMAAHGRGGSHHWMTGSVTEHLLRTVSIPLLLVPPQGRHLHFSSMLAGGEEEG